MDTGLKEKSIQYFVVLYPVELLRQMSIKNKYQSIKVAQLFQKKIVEVTLKKYYDAMI